MCSFHKCTNAYSLDIISNSKSVVNTYDYFEKVKKYQFFSKNYCIPIKNMIQLLCTCAYKRLYIVRTVLCNALHERPDIRRKP